MKKINILYILPKTTQGGSETQLLYILKNINRQHFNVHLGLFYKDGELEKEYHEIKDINIINFHKKNKWDLSVYLKIAKYIKKNNISIINSFLGFHNAYIPATLSKNCIAIGSIRSTYYPKGLAKICGLGIAKRLCKKKKLFLVSNNNTALKKYREFGFPKSCITLIPNGLVYENFSKGKKKTIQDEFTLKSKFVLGMVGRLDKRKNHLEAIKAIQQLHTTYNNIRLLIVGNGPYEQTLKTYVKELNLEKYIIFAGNRRDIPDLLNAIDIFVFPTQFPEGWPNAIGEAMCAGLPIITYPKGDIPFIIKHNKNGIISSPHTFVKDLTKLIGKKTLREKLGKTAKQSAKQYSVNNMVHAYEKYYIDILGRNS